MKSYMIADFLANLEKEYLAAGRKQHAEAIHRALADIRRASSDDEDPISEPARGHLFPLIKRAGMTLEDLKLHLKDTYDINSTKAIPWNIYEEICQWLIAKGDRRNTKYRQISRRYKKFDHVETQGIASLPTI
jgi:hypothetical protein